MGARRRMKKNPLKAAIFFIDRCVGKTSVATPPREAAPIAELHDDHDSQDALDEEWCIQVGRRRWYVIRATRTQSPAYEATSAAQEPATINETACGATSPWSS